MELEESYRNLALSQNWDAVREMFDDKDFESCMKKLEAHGMTATKEEFELISEVVATAVNDALVAEPAMLIAVAGGVSLILLVE